MNKILRTILSLIALIYMGNVFASSQYLYLTKNSGYSITNSYPTIISSNSLARCIIDPDYYMPADCTYLDAPESQIGHYETGVASYFYAHAVTVIGGYMYIVSQDTSKTTEPSKRDVTWLQYCKVSATDGGLSSCKYISAGNNYTPEIITSITSATIGGSNYVYIGGSYSQIFVDKVNSDGSLTSYGSAGNIYYGDKGRAGNLIRDIYVDATTSLPKLYFTRGPDSQSRYYEEYLPLANATTASGGATIYDRPSAQLYPYGIMSYNGNVYVSTSQVSGVESSAITEYAGVSTPVVGQFMWSPTFTAYPQGLANYYGAGGSLRTFVAFQGGVLQTCNLFPSGGIISVTCSEEEEIIYDSNGNPSSVDSTAPHLSNVYDVEVYNP